jgi:hypothetical protein
MATPSSYQDVEGAEASRGGGAGNSVSGFKVSTLEFLRGRVPDPGKVHPALWLYRAKEAVRRLPFLIPSELEPAYLFHLLPPHCQEGAEPSVMDNVESLDKWVLKKMPRPTGVRTPPPLDLLAWARTDTITAFNERFMVAYLLKYTTEVERRNMVQPMIKWYVTLLQPALAEVMEDREFDTLEEAQRAAAKLAGFAKTVNAQSERPEQPRTYAKPEAAQPRAGVMRSAAVGNNGSDDDENQPTNRGPFPWNCFACGARGHRAVECPGQKGPDGGGNRYNLRPRPDKPQPAFRPPTQE